MALLFIASLPISAFAEDWYLEDGSVAVTATSSTSETGETVTTQSVVQTSSDGSVYKQSSNDTNTVITQRDTKTATGNTVTINAADENATAEVTLKDVNIDASKTGKAAVSTNGEGDVTIELDGDNTVKSGANHAGVEKNNDGSLTITDENNDNASLEVTGGDGGAGIGGARGDAEVSNITINGGKITAKGGYRGAGIGSARNSGYATKASNITINGGEVYAYGGGLAAGIGGGYNGSASNVSIKDAKVYAEGGEGGAGIGGGYMGKLTGTVVISGDAKVNGIGYIREDNEHGKGNCAAIGNGVQYVNNRFVDGEEATLDTSKLTTKGKIECYARDKYGNITLTKTIIGTYVPPVAAKAAEQTVKLYNVVDKDGKSISYKTEVKDGVLTVTVDADYAALTGAVSGISVLTAQGIKTVVFVTSGATSTFDLADLSAKGSGTYKLTHDGATVTFTLGTTDISEILK